MTQTRVRGSVAVISERTLSAPAEMGEPAAGDVVLLEDARATGPRFTLSSFASPPGIRYASYTQALDAARAFATVQKVDGWLTRDGMSFSPIVRHRSL